MSLCQYKNIFGEPGKGVHSYRILNIAVVDMIGTILLALLLAKLFSTSFWCMFIILLLLSIIIHKVFCVETTLTNLV